MAKRSVNIQVFICHRIMKNFSFLQFNFSLYHKKKNNSNIHNFSFFVPFRHIQTNNYFSLNALCSLNLIFNLIKIFILKLRHRICLLWLQKFFCSTSWTKVSNNFLVILVGWIFFFEGIWDRFEEMAFFVFEILLTKYYN